MYFRFSFFLFFLCGLNSCNTDRLLIPPPSTKIELDVIRIEQEFEKSNTLPLMQQTHFRLTKDIPELYAYYLGACIQAGRMEDTTIQERLLDFIEDPYMIRVNKVLNTEFSDLSEEISAISTGFSYLTHYFERGPIPHKIVTYNSAFSNSVVSSPTEIGIGLERYMGGDHELIKELPEQVFFQYVKNQMDRRFLVRDVMTSWIGMHYIEEIDEDGTLAEQLIAWGKLYYLVEATLPLEGKDVILRYFPDDLDWALDNEAAFWKYLVDENFLFKRELKIARNIFSEGPFTPGLPIEDKAPPRLGHFLGWRIVKNFMNQSKHISVEELVHTDYKKILKTYKID